MLITDFSPPRNTLMLLPTQIFDEVILYKLFSTTVHIFTYPIILIFFGGYSPHLRPTHFPVICHRRAFLRFDVVDLN